MAEIMLFFNFVLEKEVSESDAESERSIRFDFLINGVYLQDTLDKHLTKYNLSTVSKIIL